MEDAPRRPRGFPHPLVGVLKPTAPRFSSVHATPGRRRLAKRIAFLREEAAFEGIRVRPGSEEDLREFIASNGLRRPMLLLSDDGEFRAVWKGPRGERIAILFEGAGQGELLLFGAVASSGKRDDLVLMCPLEQMPSRIESFDLAPVWRHAC